MAKTRFERIVETEMNDTAVGLVRGSVQAGNADRHAYACGKYQALQWVLETFRKSQMASDPDGDEI